MTGPSPHSTDSAVVRTRSASAQRFDRAVSRLKIGGELNDARRALVLAQPLTGRQRHSRDVWEGRGLSAFDATMLALQLGRSAP